MSELFKILDSKVRSKLRLTDDQRFLARLLQALPSAILSSCPISTTSASAPLIISQHQEDNAYPRTYAEAAKGEGNNSHTILLYPAVPDPNDSTAGNSNPETKSVRELLSSKLNTTNEKIKIKSYRRIRNKGSAVDCENNEEIQKLIDKIQKSDELKENILHKDPKKRRPRCIIYNIPKDTTEQDVIDTIELAIECDRNSTGFPRKLKGRKERYQHWVVELPTPAFFTLEAAGKLVMNWSIYRIKEFFSVRR
ncbi:hypothetical protein AVEN_12378-1 [Araneus ventricosus]|uniref:Uncharacterized protein n=1 Tax=Araneus ventricosus TaxID=182803 RepID=A0A4Y2JDM4_ARAVE|nr:hypothetical protein AVEN_12378-1 [Araneus ventricosus]